MDLEVRKPDATEIPAVFDMMCRFAAFEELLDQMTAEEKDLYNAVFGEGAFAEALIAVLDGSPAGYAIFYPHFSSFRGEPGYYLEDIYVEADFRDRGVGKALLRSIARRARERGFKRIDFQVLSFNRNAINFYQSLGAVCVEDERHFKFSGEAFDRLSG